MVGCYERQAQSYYLGVAKQIFQRYFLRFLIHEQDGAVREQGQLRKSCDLPASPAGDSKQSGAAVTLLPLLGQRNG